MPDAWIRQWGDPALREAAAPVGEVDDIVRAQARRMCARLIEADGAGLAGPQVGVMRKIFVYRASAEEEVRTLVDPHVIESSSERVTFIEGCLSFMSVTVAVERPVAVRVQALSLDGEQLTLEAEGFGASLLQHEIDHLDGILTLDRAEPSERRRAISALLEEGRARREAAALAA